MEIKKTKVYIKDKRWEIIIEAINYIDHPTLSKIESLIKKNRVYRRLENYH